MAGDGGAWAAVLEGRGKGGALAGGGRWGVGGGAALAVGGEGEGGGWGWWRGDGHCVVSWGWRLMVGWRESTAGMVAGAGFRQSWRARREGFRDGAGTERVIVEGGRKVEEGAKKMQA